ncbi:MAG: hypothetical protein Q9M91_02680 [Candidatus Dojkabacteria bacterium]|nr:hypothetical protein [Candidatus Dojkabacteria bacterium]
MTFEERVLKSEFDKLENIVKMKVDSKSIYFTVKGNVDKFIQVIAKHNPVDLVSTETHIEDLFIHYYETKK